MEISEWIALAGVIVTGAFTWLVYRATLASAEVAKETLKLNKQMIKEERERVVKQKKIMRTQLRRIILDETRRVESALASIDEKIIHRNLMSARTELSVQINELAEYFSPEEVNLIRKGWGSYENYR